MKLLYDANAILNVNKRETINQLDVRVLADVVKCKLPFIFCYRANFILGVLYIFWLASILILTTDNALSSALLSSGKALSSGQNPASREFLFSKSSQ